MGYDLLEESADKWLVRMDANSLLVVVQKWTLPRPLMEESLWTPKLVTLQLERLPAAYLRVSTRSRAMPNVLFVLRVISANLCGCWMSDILWKG